MGPTGAFIEPLGELTFDEVYANYYESVKILADAGVDYISSKLVLKSKKCVLLFSLLKMLVIYL